MLSLHRRHLLGLALLALLALPTTGRADNALSSLAKGSSFGADLAPATRKKIVVEVPLVAEQGARVLMANHRELKRLGLQPPKNGLSDSTYEKQLLGAFAFRPATADEIKNKTYTHMGLATRYADKLGDGGVKGDGRAVLVGDVVVKNRQGRITGVYDIQVKGIGTGLHPNWKGFGHRHGRESLRQAMEDALFSDYLATNGIRTNNWLAVIDTGKTIEYPDGGKERAGLLVRGGNFLRLAHLNLVKDDPTALKDLIGHVNRTLSVELGRKRPLSLTGLYKLLTQRKAHELADMYFLRTVHGSSTYDNIGLVENMDHGTGSTVDRTHKNYSYFSKWVGFGGEPAFVLSQYYDTELISFLKQVASPAERKALDKLRPAKMTKGMLEHRMQYQLLLHIGLSEKDAAHAMRKQRKPVKALLEAVLKLANTTEPGRKHQMGPTTVENPARYDVFGALDTLAKVYLNHDATTGRAQALVGALRKDGPQNAEDVTAATSLVKAFEGVMTPRLTRVRDKAQQRTQLLVMGENASARNRHAATMVRQSLRDYAGGTVQRIERGEQVESIRADLNAFKRLHVVKGQGSSTNAAQRVLSGQAKKTSDGFVVLNRSRENGVSIAEISSGTRDLMRVEITGNPLKLGDVGRYGMRYQTSSGQWIDVQPTAVRDGKAIFDIHVIASAAPKSFQAAFYNRDNSSAPWWNNAGRNFGTNMPLVLGSQSVHLALGVEAQRRGETRGGLDSGQLAMVKTMLTGTRVVRERKTKHQARLARIAKEKGVSGVREAKLSARRTRTAKPTATPTAKTTTAQPTAKPTLKTGPVRARPKQTPRYQPRAQVRRR